MRSLLHLILCTFLFIAPASANSLEDGKTAYQSQNWFEAIKILRPLAEDGNDQALVLLGNMYNDGNGVEQNHELAFNHYKRALINQNDQAMLAIATMYTNGLGVEKDFPAGFRWFEKSANAGNPAAQFMLASFYLGGHQELPDLEVNPTTSYTWYRIAALQTDLPDVATAAKGFAKRLTAILSPEDIIEGEDAAKAFYAVREEGTEK